MLEIGQIAYDSLTTRAGAFQPDPQGQFYDRQAQPVTREAALEQAGQSSAHSIGADAQVLSGSKDNADLGLSL